MVRLMLPASLSSNQLIQLAADINSKVHGKELTVYTSCQSAESV